MQIATLQIAERESQVHEVETVVRQRSELEAIVCERNEQLTRMATAFRMEEEQLCESVWQHAQEEAARREGEIRAGYEIYEAAGLHARLTDDERHAQHVFEIRTLFQEMRPSGGRGRETSDGSGP